MTNSHGGKRLGAGQKKKTDADKRRIRNWYEMVCEAIEHPIDNSVTNVWHAIRVEMERFYPHAAASFGGETAWYAYAKGDRYPHKDIALNIDLCIVARNNQADRINKLLIRHPIRWVLSRPGFLFDHDSQKKKSFVKLNLTPVWGWSPFASKGINQNEIPLAAKVNEEFYERIPAEKAFIYLQEAGLITAENEPIFYTNNSIFVEEATEWQPYDFKWPPILLLPKVLADSCTTNHPELTFPVLQECPPGIDYTYANVDRTFDYEKMLWEFAEWSMSVSARTASGDIWLEKISAYLSTVYFYGNNPIESAIYEEEALNNEMVEFAEEISHSFANRPRSKPEDDPFFQCIPNFDD